MSNQLSVFQLKNREDSGKESKRNAKFNLSFFYFLLVSEN
jgi:hypothetical protein